jgi:hypothetical protein
MSRFICVTIDGVWIGEWIYWPLIRIHHSELHFTVQCYTHTHTHTHTHKGITVKHQFVPACFPHSTRRRRKLYTYIYKSLLLKRQPRENYHIFIPKIGYRRIKTLFIRYKHISCNCAMCKNGKYMRNVPVDELCFENKFFSFNKHL